MTKRFPINSILFNQLYGFLTICLYGWFFFEQILSYNISPYYLPFAFVITWQLLFILFSLFPNHKIFNFIKSLLLISNAFVFYFIYAYHTPVDKIMFMNAMQTDSAEVKELLNKQLFYFIILLGILPCILINTLQIHPSPNKRIFKSLCISICSMLIVGGISYKSTNILLHKFKYLQNYISPINYIIGGSQALIEHFKPRPPLQSISEDVDTLPTPNKPNLIVFILGETTRAANFSLNGYHRPTNQPLDAYLNEIIYYPNTLACGTSTAVAVPCIFSKDPQKTFKTGSEVYTENILDIFKKAGYKIWWRDNDGGCKDVCNRVIYDEPCQNKSCIDNVLFNNLKEKIANNKDNQLIILHTRGSHGPAYHLRYEEDSNIYSPICTKNALWECPQEELINVYDNTNHYVSKFIAQTIEILKSLQNEFNPILFYTSDHGESLGENKVYLHAAPYTTAPAEQKEVPMLVWLPQDNNLNLQHKCLKTDITGKSHDNIFHSLLGISGISSTYYQKDLDIFSKCNKNQ